MNFQYFLEKQRLFWLFVAGLALIIFGIYFFMEIQTAERNRETVRMNRIFRLIYDLGGKYTILALFEMVGLIAVISGIKQLKNN